MCIFSSRHILNLLLEDFGVLDLFNMDDQLEPIYYSSVPIQVVAFNTYKERWTIEKGGGRVSTRSVMAA